MTDQTTACHSTQHCATHDFCHRCAPSLHKATQHLVKAIDAAGIQYRASGRVYAQLAATVRDAARTASGQQPETTPCGHCKGSGADPEDEGDYVPEVHRHNPFSVGPCPECNGDGTAVGQPAEAQATDTSTWWTIQAQKPTGSWFNLSEGFSSVDEARAWRDTELSEPRNWSLRIVRMEQTETVEDETR